MAQVQNITIQQGESFQLAVRWASLPLVFKPISAITNAAPVVVTATGHGVPAGWPVAITGVKGMSQINALNLPPAQSDYYPATVIDANTLAFPDLNSALMRPYTSGGFVQYYTPQSLLGCTGRMSIKSTQSPLIVPGVYTGASFSHVGTTVTVTTSGTAHGLSVGNIVQVNGVLGAGASTYNGVYTVASVPGPNVFTYLSANGASDVANTPGMNGPFFSMTYSIELFRLDSASTARITFDTVSQVINLQIAAADSLQLGFPNGYYDLDITTPAGIVTTLLTGTVTVNPAVTTT